MKDKKHYDKDRSAGTLPKEAVTARTISLGDKLWYFDTSLIRVYLQSNTMYGTPISTRSACHRYILIIENSIIDELENGTYYNLSCREVKSKLKMGTIPKIYTPRIRYIKGVPVFKYTIKYDEN